MRTPGPRRRTVATALAIVLVVAVGCSRSDASVPPEDLPVGEALTSLVAARGGQTTMSGDIVVDTVLVTSMDRVTVEEPITLEEVTPLRVDPAVEVVTVVVSFMRRDHELLAQGFLGEVCLPGWPPRGALVDPDAPPEDVGDGGWLHEVAGLGLQPGDEFTFSLVTRPTQVGQWSAHGLRIVYRSADGRRFQQTSEAGAVEFETRARPAGPGSSGGCDGTEPVGGGWGG